MIGRSAYYDPFRILGTADRVIYGDTSGFEKTRQQVCTLIIIFNVCVRVYIHMCVYVSVHIDRDI